MCENGYAVPYVGQNKKDVEELHVINRQKLIERGEVV
jgi:micrococcal nuclease